jgi:RimJ/RimL family protein N-acetyltransferase
MARRPHWPLFNVVVRTPRLVIRLPNDDDLEDLVRLALRGVHDPATMPFAVPWTDEPSPALERNALQWWWRQRAEWSAAKWTFTGAVFVDGVAAGVQDLSAEGFALLRAVSTGSWLGREFQGRGLGKEMRAAILHFAFAGLGASVAYSGA